MNRPAEGRELADAGALAFAMLRFETAAANRYFAGGRSDQGALGTDAFLFLPGGRSLSREEVVPYLANSPSPAILVPTTTAGIVKNPGQQINYGTGKDVSDESVADGREPLTIRWLASSYVELPLRR